MSYGRLHVIFTHSLSIITIIILTQQLPLAIATLCIVIHSCSTSHTSFFTWRPSIHNW